jgi:hypothetical protein
MKKSHYFVRRRGPDSIPEYHEKGQNLIQMKTSIEVDSGLSLGFHFLATLHGKGNCQHKHTCHRENYFDV